MADGHREKDLLLAPAQQGQQPRRIFLKKFPEIFDIVQFNYFNIFFMLKVLKQCCSTQIFSDKKIVLISI